MSRNRQDSQITLAKDLAKRLLEELRHHEPKQRTDGLVDGPHVVWMCEQVLNSETPEELVKTVLPGSFKLSPEAIDYETGLHRWIGFVQGWLCAQGMSNVNMERRRVRNAKTRLEPVYRITWFR